MLEYVHSFLHGSDAWIMNAEFLVSMEGLRRHASEVLGCQGVRTSLKFEHADKFKLPPLPWIQSLRWNSRGRYGAPPRGAPASTPA